MVRTFKHTEPGKLAILGRRTQACTRLDETIIAVDVEEAKELRTALTDFVEEQALKSTKQRIDELFRYRTYSVSQAEILRNHFAAALEMVIVS